MMGRVNYLVRGEVKNLARFCMRKDYLSRAFYPTQSSSSGNSFINNSFNNEGSSEDVKWKDNYEDDNDDSDINSSSGGLQGKKNIENLSVSSQDQQLQLNNLPFLSSFPHFNDLGNEK